MLSVSGQFGAPAAARRSAWLHRGVTCCLVAALALPLTACDNMSMTEQGAGVGVLLGAGLGYALGGEKGALIGAGIGALGGAVGGHLLETRKQHFASAEEELRVRTEEAQTAAAEQRKRADVAGREASSAERQVRALRRAAARGQDTSYKKLSMLRDLKDQQSQLEKQLKDGKYAEQTVRGQANDLQRRGQDASRLQGQASNLEHSNAKLQDALQRLDGAMANIDA